MKITWLGHSAFRIEMGGKIVLIDPFLTGNGSFKGTVEAASAGVTHILVTHGHDDHVGDAGAIAASTGAQVVANYEVAMYLQGKGAKNINPGNTGGVVDCGGFTVAFTQAQHSSAASGPNGPIYLGNPNGLVIDHPHEPTLYHMGDTDIFGDMALINELHKPRIGIVPIGDRFTMGGRTAALAVKRFFDFDAVLPCHYKTFPILAQDAHLFVDALKGERVKVHVPESGESVTV